jgi:hypothetical protein
LSFRIVFSFIALHFAAFALAQSNPFVASTPVFKPEALPPPTNSFRPSPGSAQLLPPLPPLPLANLPSLHVLSVSGNGKTKAAIIGIAVNPSGQAPGGTQIASTLIVRNGESVKIERSSYVAEIDGDGVLLRDSLGEVAWQGRIEFPVVQPQNANAPGTAGAQQGSAGMTVGMPMPSPSAKIIGASSSIAGSASGGSPGGGAVTQNQSGAMR